MSISCCQSQQNSVIHQKKPEALPAKHQRESLHNSGQTTTRVCCRLMESVSDQREKISGDGTKEGRQIHYQPARQDRKRHWNADTARMEILRVKEKDIPPGEYVQMHQKEKTLSVYVMVSTKKEDELIQQTANRQHEVQLLYQDHQGMEHATEPSQIC